MISRSQARACERPLGTKLGFEKNLVPIPDLRIWEGVEFVGAQVIAPFLHF